MSNPQKVAFLLLLALLVSGNDSSASLDYEIRTEDVPSTGHGDMTGPREHLFHPKSHGCGRPHHRLDQC